MIVTAIITYDRYQNVRQISEKFGAEVLQIVLAVTHTTRDTDGNLFSSEGKKVVYLEHLADASDKARWVSAADKLHNARAILSDLPRASIPSDVWDRFNVGRDASIHCYRRVYNRLVEVGFSGAILPELLDAVECLEASTPISLPNPTDPSATALTAL